LHELASEVSAGLQLTISELSISGFSQGIHHVRRRRKTATEQLTVVHG